MAFQDVTAMATMTLLAVPSILTPTPPGDILASTRESSVLTAYRKAGFKVYWLSTQRKHGTYDTLTSIFSEDADESEFLGGIFDAAGRGGYSGKKDIHLLPEVQKILARNESKVLLVLHTMGSHGPYGMRYPKSHEAFKSRQTGVLNAAVEMALRESNDPKDLQELTNAYDNTIFSTDFLLANLIHLLKMKNSISWFCYISDHGENGADAQTARFMHGVMTPDVLKVPMVMWLSDEYRRCHPTKAAALQANVNKPFSATCTYHTLLDAGGLSAPNLRPEWSAAAENFHPGPRKLYGNSGNNVIDYDREIAPMFAESRKGWHPLKPKSVKLAETGAE
jgi:glucan phosphoethanolaminetransferase (alkaline phosphatase superfamily)